MIMINNLIFPYDYILIVILVLIVFLYFIKGFIQSILSLLTWVGSILITIYSYEAFASFSSKQLLNFDYLKNYEYLTNITGIIFGIPLIFLFSLFILKRIRKFLSEDLDKQILGVIFDKIFGFIYGFVFFYVVLSALLILSNRFELNKTNNWLNENSFIIFKINEFNTNNFYSLDGIEDINEN